MPWPERDRIVDRLLALREKCPGSLRTTAGSLRLMRSASAGKVTKHCLFTRKAFAYDAAGQAKPKCMMGAKADCSRCGCIVPFYLHSLVHGTGRA